MICDVCKQETYQMQLRLVGLIELFECEVCQGKKTREQHDAHLVDLEQYKDYELVAFDSSGHDTLMDLPTFDTEPKLQ